MTMIEKKELLTIRPFQPTDENFIYATWLKFLHHSDPLFKRMTAKVFEDFYRIVIAEILKKSETIVCCLLDDHDVIIGYAVRKGPVLHWAHVKENWRGIGIFRDLLKPEPVLYLTHTNPFLLRFQNDYDKKPLSPLFFAAEKEIKA